MTNADRRVMRNMMRMIEQRTCLKFREQRGPLVGWGGSSGVLNPIHILIAWKLWWIKIPGGTPPSCARKSNHLSFRARWKAKVILRCQKDELLSIFFFVSGSVQRSMRWNQIWHRCPYPRDPKSDQHNRQQNWTAEPICLPGKFIDSPVYIYISIYLYFYHYYIFYIMIWSN